jgi:hypothetical protein
MRFVGLYSGTVRWVSFVLISGIMTACGQPPANEPPASGTAAARAQNAAQRGAYLVTIIGCNDCHTPFKMGAAGPEPDMTRMLSGHPESLKTPSFPKLPPDGSWGFAGGPTNTAWAGPWGISFTANLTPDQNTGLGIWTEEMFVNALRQGKHMGTSRPILPPMPWPFYAKMTDDDLKAIFAYLRTIPAITNHVPDPIAPTGQPATH